MNISASVPDDGVISAVDGPRVWPSGPPPGREGGAVTLRLARERDRTAEAMNDIVVRRLFAAGLCLETALALMGEHPGARRVRGAVGELDLAVREFRNVLFDRHRPDPPLGGQPG